jgi:hypothetical protein
LGELSRAFYRLRAIVFVAFGSLIFLDGFYQFALQSLRGIFSGAWHFAPFRWGFSPAQQHIHAASPIVQAIVDFVWDTPAFLLMLLIGGGLVWQGLRGLTAD